MNKEDVEMLKENFASKEDFEKFAKAFQEKGGSAEQAVMAQSLISHLQGDCEDQNCQFHGEKEKILQEGFTVGYLTRDLLG